MRFQAGAGPGRASEMESAFKASFSSSGAIRLWDTAGQERLRVWYSTITEMHMLLSCVCYDHVARSHSLPSWLEECKQHSPASDIPRFLLERNYAFETSAKNPNGNDHVEVVFMSQGHKLKSHKPLMLSQPPDNGIILKPGAK
ncbi:unnamed protein product [Nyctereutes procyonoides]|uniref:(raccoon dog) hypothetical protein n=1 Tax=Nyctereutes procyonoides TaxID=34880 RepID=A0A811Y159_NYCPR|nr:unnamed protein product [Nyctereutes procyonoides]